MRRPLTVTWNWRSTVMLREESLWRRSTMTASTHDIAELGRHFDVWYEILRSPCDITSALCTAQLFNCGKQTRVKWRHLLPHSSQLLNVFTRSSFVVPRRPATISESVKINTIHTSRSTVRHCWPRSLPHVSGTFCRSTSCQSSPSSFRRPWRCVSLGEPVFFNISQVTWLCLCSEFVISDNLVVYLEYLLTYLLACQVSSSSSHVTGQCCPYEDCRCASQDNHKTSRSSSNDMQTTIYRALTTSFCFNDFSFTESLPF